MYDISFMIFVQARGYDVDKAENMFRTVSSIGITVATL